MDRWLKQQPLKRKLSSVIATVSRETTETVTANVRAASDSDDENQKHRKVRRYDENYLSFGFSWCGEEKNRNLSV